MLNHWDEYKQRLRAYIIKRVDDRASVDDILQDVYLKAQGNIQLCA